MANEPNWGKWGTIAAWLFGAPMLILAVLSYVRPPDPTHPMKFDFLMRTVSISLWLAVSIIVAVILITALITRKASPGLAELKAKMLELGQRLDAEMKLGEGYRSRLQQDQREIRKREGRIAALEEEVAQCDQFKRQLSDLQSQNSSLRSQLQAANREPIKRPALDYGGDLPCEKLPNFDSAAERIVLAWPDELQVRIWRYSNSHTKGLLFELANLRATWIGSFTLEITDATSWDQHHSQFRESRYFTPFQLADGKELGPSCTTGAQWCLRTKEGKILLGNSQEPALSWPSEDSSATQVWRLNLRLCVDTHHEPGKNLHMLKPLPPATLLISWDMSTDVVSMAEQNSAISSLP